ncbi:MAG: alpha/beta hydrolase [Pirellulales bacterium]
MAVEEFNLVLFSGLAADSNVFEAQRTYFELHGHQVHIVPWLEPLPREGLDEYAGRLISDYSQLPNLVLGGASFGGVVAQHAASHAPARGLILIGSVRQPQDLPLFAKLARPVRWLVRLIPVGMLKLLARTALRFKTWPKSWKHLRPIVDQFSDCNSKVFRWSLLQLLTWTEPVKLTIPVFEIHGSRDRALPLRKTFTGTVIPDAGHVLSLSHPAEVNQFIEQCLTQLNTRA